MNCLARETKTAAQLDKARREYGLFLLELRIKNRWEIKLLSAMRCEDGWR